MSVAPRLIVPSIDPSPLFPVMRIAPQPLRSPAALAQKIQRLAVKRDLLAERDREIDDKLVRVRAYLAVAAKVTDALEVLSRQLFDDVLRIIEEKMSVALQEVLEQPITLKAEVDWKRGAPSVEFCILRDGQREDIMRGQGGSVANILSVGLRMFALTTLDESVHRRFLVLDEQDCWLRPDLVPRLVKIVHEAGSALGFQVLMISHHDVSTFAQYADRIYQLEPTPEGVKATVVGG